MPKLIECFSSRAPVVVGVEGEGGRDSIPALYGDNRCRTMNKGWMSAVSHHARCLAHITSSLKGQGRHSSLTK